MTVTIVIIITEYDIKKFCPLLTIDV